MLLASIQGGGGNTESLVGFIGFIVVAGGIAIALIVGSWRSARAEAAESEAETPQ